MPQTVSKYQSGNGLFFRRGLKMIRKLRRASRETGYSSGLTSLCLKSRCWVPSGAPSSLFTRVLWLHSPGRPWSGRPSARGQSRVQESIACSWKHGLCWESSTIHRTPGYRARKPVSTLLNTTIKISEEFKIAPSKEKCYTLENP